MTTPLNLLVAGDDIDSRITGRKSGIKELAASIEAHGLLQPLNVRPIEGGKFQVTDGNRRLLALQQLARAKKIDKAFAVDTVVMEKDDAAAREASLAANIVRLELEPVDVFQQFAALAEHENVEAIAIRFGVTDKLVRQRLALGKLAPEVLDALRKGKLRLDLAQAFTISDDHDAQRAALKGLRISEYTRPDDVKRSLAKDSLDVDTGIVKFVGLDAYVAAGGTVKESLFDKDSYIEDSGLIHRLAREKMEREADRLRGEGWSFVEIDSDDLDASDYSDVDFQDHMTAEEKAAYEKEPHEYTSKAEKIEKAVKERMIADQAVRSASGCIVRYRDHSGAIEVDHAVVKVSENDQDNENEEGDEDSGDDGGESGAEKQEATKSLMEAPTRVSRAEAKRLSGTLSEAIGRSLPNSLSVAVCALIATIGSYQSPLDIRSTDSHVDLGGRDSDEADEREWRDDFNAALALDAEGQIRQLAEIVGRTVHISVPGFGFGFGYADDDDNEALIDAIGPEVFNAAMKEAFSPRDYFQRGTSKMALDALKDMGVPPPGNRSKSNLVEKATENAVEQGYLPPELRTVHYDGPGRAPAMQEEAE